MTKDDALAAMILSIQSGEPRHFYVGLVGYFIEGTPYGADGLSVDIIATPNIRPTQEGFMCEALFPPHLLSDEIVSRSRRVLLGTSDGDLVTDLIAAQLEVRRQDVWTVAEFIGGVQHDLFMDATTLEERQIAFHRLSQAWAAAPGDSSTH